MTGTSHKGLLANVGTYKIDEKDEYDEVSDMYQSSEQMILEVPKQKKLLIICNDLTNLNQMR